MLFVINRYSAFFGYIPVLIFTFWPPESQEVSKAKSYHIISQITNHSYNFSFTTEVCTRNTIPCPCLSNIFVKVSRLYPISRLSELILPVDYWKYVSLHGPRLPFSITDSFTVTLSLRTYALCGKSKLVLLSTLSLSLNGVAWSLVGFIA